MFLESSLFVVFYVGFGYRKCNSWDEMRCDMLMWTLHNRIFCWKKGGSFTFYYKYHEDPYTAHKIQGKPYFCNIYPYALRVMGKCTSRHLFLLWRIFERSYLHSISYFNQKSSIVMASIYDASEYMKGHIFER